IQSKSKQRHRHRTRNMQIAGSCSSKQHPCGTQLQATKQLEQPTKLF
ncbi:hypothetical protein AWRI1631_134070, partial [Saccharomyces cerevisiae AWRI1631]